MSEFNRLRMELKTDIELIALRQEHMAKTMDRWSSRFEEQGHQVASQGQQIAEQGRLIAAHGERINEMAQQMNVHHQETARLGREVAEGQRWTQGRLRLLGERFDAVLGAVYADQTEDHDLLMDLRERVERLEEHDQPPAA